MRAGSKPANRIALSDVARQHGFAITCPFVISRLRALQELLRRARAPESGTRPSSELLIVLSQCLEPLVVKLLEIEQYISRPLRHADEFVDLDMHCSRVAVLGVLDHEHHQKSNDGRRRVELRVARCRCSQTQVPRAPNEDSCQGRQEGDRTPRNVGNPLGKICKPEPLIGAA
jgi:hypothetical protein